MKTWVYPGSFDPVTCGHYDIILRASKLSDELIVVVMNNPKKQSFFSVDERVDMLRAVVDGLDNVKIECYNGLSVDFARAKNASAVVRGLRAVTDFENELQWANVNQKLDESFQALFMMASSEYSFLSSSTVKQIAAFGGDISQLVPTQIHDFVKRRLIEKGE